ncbi:MAG: flippase-like domain-containing protein [Chloroflexi bacterium]|nr:flippase-like domain-containing protein [Chloroflexota bacterium]MBI3338591.1 flippase-like domain-containing protein [Chloroflexota bacterium]
MQNRSSLKTFWNFFKIILAVALVGFVISKTNLAEVIALLKRLSFGWLAISFLLFCILTLIKTFQYYLLTGRQVSYWRVLYIVILQNALSNFIAGGAGIASYLTMLSVDEGVRFRKVLSAFVVAKMGDLLAVWAILFASSVFLWNQIGAVRYAVVFLLAVIWGAVAVFVAAALLRQKFVALVKTLLGRIKLDRLAVVRRGVDFLQLFSEQDSRAVLQALLIALLYSLIYMIVTLFWFYSNIRAYSLDFPFTVVTFVNAFVQLISWIPIQVFGGLGVSETSLVYLFGIFGLPAAQTAAIGIGFRVILYAFTLLIMLYLPLSALIQRSQKRK